MTAKEIAVKYVYCNHDALTDNQEVIDMVKDIEDYSDDLEKENKALTDDMNSVLNYLELALDRVDPTNAIICAKKIAKKYELD